MITESIRILRAWRVFKRLPSTFWREFWAPLWNREQLLALLLACVGTALVFQTSDAAAIADEGSTWVQSFASFVWGLPIWAALMAIRAPFVVIADERRKGSWYGGRFIYRQPELAATFRCKATGEPQLHPFKFEDAEPGSFVYFSIEVEGDPPRNLYSASVVHDLILLRQMTEVGRGVGRGDGLRIGPSREASLLIVMAPSMNSQTVRVFMHDFSLVNPDDKDGAEGTPFGKNPQIAGGDRAQIALDR